MAIQLTAAEQLALSMGKALLMADAIDRIKAGVPEVDAITTRAIVGRVELYPFPHEEFGGAVMEVTFKGGGGYTKPLSINAPGDYIIPPTLSVAGLKEFIQELKEHLAKRGN